MVIHSFMKRCAFSPKNIYGALRIFEAHAQELHNPIPQKPYFFKKPLSALASSTSVVFDAQSGEIHYELELAVHICKNSYKLSLQDADDCFDYIGLGLDFTNRRLQSELKEQKMPWLLAKGFKNSCALSDFVLKPYNLHDLSFALLINGVEKQKGHLHDMLFSPQEQLVALTEHIALEEHDILLTGTPQGVGALYHGDHLLCLLYHKNTTVLEQEFHIFYNRL